ncbi:unnamed protein product [Vitrella brassicaformis CCMP3155]|uniref:Ribosomal protein L11 N-terminal domain-containing protein n=1 Tax=Vitrella brassicaformis (strain CCMP3155) TaxID=1169540 RepID=A0A0G4GU90_VITBC|nr:unnamed protein product [Vitrella brassicaformis CCMP3155]|mmetsp:Transcript_18119/g.43635  ORF Transcript_18119/g.43635 Transcript_18119/m.43635 type:complete len:178 (-) Transcript_18119:199-732(-)|eukprot:CEM34398.1 unnamed protein product [Vitrella brassicaformis CCMP3155]
MSLIGRFNLVINAGSAKPSPAIGQALGPLGINMMQFCKEFNARTSKVRPDVPIQVQLLPLTDRTFKFWLRGPPAFWFIRRVARVPLGSAYPGHDILGNITLKEIYHIAKAKCMDPPLVGRPLKSIVAALIGTGNAMGVTTSRELLPEFIKRDFVEVGALDAMKARIKAQNKAQKRKK